MILTFNLILRNLIRLTTDKDRELGDAQAEIKALRYSERLKEKAVEEIALEAKNIPMHIITLAYIYSNPNYVQYWLI
ncbi:Microtubule-associated protein 70 [Dillenia turbinata]|uniref:Microtubule-associated protein 70 n=1 Tax=Dillenia turbinata TaxID=194707 RepID=A0AAN8Z404_9MAGN